MLFSGLVLLISVFIPPEETSLLVMVSMVGKLAITSAYGTVYIFSTELFPTRFNLIGSGGNCHLIN